MVTITWWLLWQNVYDGDGDGNTSFSSRSRRLLVGFMKSFGEKMESWKILGVVKKSGIGRTILEYNKRNAITKAQVMIVMMWSDDVTMSMVMMVTIMATHHHERNKSTIITILSLPFCCASDDAIRGESVDWGVLENLHHVREVHSRLGTARSKILCNTKAHRWPHQHCNVIITVHTITIIIIDIIASGHHAIMRCPSHRTSIVIRTTTLPSRPHRQITITLAALKLILICSFSGATSQINRKPFPI